MVHNRRMKCLLIPALLASSMLLNAEESLKREVISHLDVVLKKSEGVPQGMTADVLYGEISKGADFSLTGEQVKQLAGGKTLHTDAERAALLKQCEQLKDVKTPLFEGSMISTLNDAEADARQREAAYQLLGLFNQQKFLRMSFMNMNRGKQFYLRQHTEGPDAKQDESMMFEGFNGKQKWLFKPEGYGELKKGADGSQVIIMSPEPLAGKLILICKDGSARIKAVEEVKEVIDLGEVKLPTAE